MGRSKRNKDKLVGTAELRAQNRELKRVLFHEGQYRPQIIPNKKKELLNKGFKDEY